MIVVCGVPEWHVEPDGRGHAAGTAVDVARAAVVSGARVELIGRLGDDPTGDALLLDLATAGIGHVAVLRDPGRPTPLLSVPATDPASEDPLAEPDAELPVALPASDPAGSLGRPILDAADLELGLRYLVDYQVVVVAEALDPSATRIVADAAGFAGAHVIVLVPPGSGGAVGPSAGAGSSSAATVLEVPEADTDGAFGAVVGAYAAALDRGTDPASAFRESLAARGWEPIEA